MSEPMIIDKKTMKMLCRIYKYDEIILDALEEQFGSEGRNMLLFLCNDHLLCYRTPEGRLTYDTTSASFNGFLGLTMKGRKCVEDYRNSFLHWMVPTIIAALSLAISVATLCVSLIAPAV